MISSLLDTRLTKLDELEAEFNYCPPGIEWPLVFIVLENDQAQFLI